MATAVQGKPGLGKTVLIVDDNAVVRAALCNLFRSDGFGLCVEAEDGRKAIAAALECKFDLIILDMVMPVMNGLAAAPKLKALFPHSPIILFSLHADYLKREDLTLLGIAATFPKGDPLDQLLVKAHALLRQIIKRQHHQHCRISH